VLKYLLRSVAQCVPNRFRTALMSRLTVYCLIAPGAIAGLVVWQSRSPKPVVDSRDRVDSPELHSLSQFGPADSVLDPEKQKATRDSEHATFEIETYFGERFLQAVASRSVDQVACSDFATSMGVSRGDLDNDGIAEIYVANMYSEMEWPIIGGVADDDFPPGVFEQIQESCAGNTIYRKASLSEPFQELSHSPEVNAVGWAFATAMADFNGDGWIDLHGGTGDRSFQRRKPDVEHVCGGLL